MPVVDNYAEQLRKQKQPTKPTNLNKRESPCYKKQPSVCDKEEPVQPPSPGDPKKSGPSKKPPAPKPLCTPLPKKPPVPDSGHLERPLLEFPHFLRVIGPKQLNVLKRFIPSAVTYCTASLFLVIWMSDWKVVLKYLPYYNGKFADEIEVPKAAVSEEPKNAEESVPAVEEKEEEE